VMIIWWSKHVGMILNVLVCEIWINVLIQTSALVGPLYTGNIHCNKEIHFTCRECVTDVECLIAKLFAFILFYICLTLFKKYEFWMISDNFLLCVIPARVSVVFEQHIYVKDSHVPYTSSHTETIYSSVRPSSRLPCYMCLAIYVI
jgi:hypothetical protein